VRILSDADVARVLTMKDTLAALERSYGASARGATVSSPWVQLFVESDEPQPDNVRLAGCQLRTASGYTPGTDVIAVRLSADIAQFGDINGSIRRRNLPAAHGMYVGLVMLFSVRTGEPLALFPDAHIQNFRVGATNALGTKYISREDAHTVGLLGAGWQAEARLQAYREGRDIREVRVFSPRRESREDFARRMTALLGIPVTAVDSAAAAVEDADIIAAATSSIVPVVEESWVRPGVHIDSLREVEFSEAIIKRADVAAYNRRDPEGAQVLTVRQERYTAISAGTNGGYPEINDPAGWWNEEDGWDRMTTLEELIVGDHPGRERPDQVTLFLSRGVAHQFSAVGAVILERAAELGLGLEVPHEMVLQDRPT